MESHLPRSHAQQEENPDQHHGLHSGEDHEKKSVIKKVKAKAKKLKDTITKHGHAHDHDHDHHHEYEDHVDDDEDEETVEDPEIHGAPIGGPDAYTAGQPGKNLEKPSVMAEDRYDSKMIKDPPVRPFVQRREDISCQPKGNLTESESHLPVDKHVSFSPGNYMAAGHNQGEQENLGRERVKIGMQTGMEEDPHAPTSRGATSNIQAKATDPTGRGSEEAGITPILQSLDKMGIYDDSERGKEHIQYTGSHDQFAPEPLPCDNQDSFLKRYDTSKPEDMPRDTVITGNPSNQSSGGGGSSTYTQKISSAIADKAKSATNVVASKLGYGGTGNHETTIPHNEEVNAGGNADSKSASELASDNAHKIVTGVAETLAPVYGKVAGAGSAVLSKVPGTGSTGQESGESKGQQDKGVSVKEYWTEKLRPGEEDKALSDVITGTFRKPIEETEKKMMHEEGMGGRGVCEVTSDALHKREPEEEEEEGDRKPMGKVTESEEVAKRLDTGEEGCGSDAAGNVGAGKGVVDRLKGIVGSWLGKGGDSQTSPSTTYVGGNEGLSSSAAGVHDHDQDQDQDQDVAGGRRLQESTN